MSRLPRMHQRAIWGGIIKDDVPREPSTVLAEFESHSIRMVTIKGEPWWVASDVCQALGLSNPTRALGTLDDDETSSLTLGKGTDGNPIHRIVNESGLYNLIFKSRKPEAKRFRKWVTSEVLPEIRRTGTYTMRGNRVAKEARRLKCDTGTAKVRCDQFTLNKSISRDTVDDGGCPRDIQDIQNAIYRGQFGDTASGLRPKVDLKNYRGTPLDRMGRLPLSANQHIKVLVSEKIKALGKDLPFAARAKIAEEIAQEVASEDMKKLGPGFYVGIKDDPMRGKIIDVIRNELAAGLVPMEALS